MRVLTGMLLAWVVAGLHVPAQAQNEAPASGIYTCTDARGRRLTSDRPIPECVDRVQKLLNPSGTVKANVGPSLTAQQRAEIEAKQKQEAAAREQAAEERRRDRALLVRYPSKEVHDKERAEAVAQIGVVIQAANKRIENLMLDRRKLDEEMEFYKKDPKKAPQALRHQMDAIAQSIAVQKRFIGEQENEIRRVHARYDEDLARLNQLWLAQPRVAPAAANAKKTP